jgi:hypothetical protein
MTRHEQILSEVQKRFSSNDTHLVSKISTFIDGAKWADANPQLSKDKFIEKARWWLRETAHFYVSDFTGELDDNGLLEDFKKAMEE